MSVWLHPWLAALWVVLLTAELALFVIVPTKSLFGGYATLVAARTAALIALSCYAAAQTYFWLFWIGQFALHASAFAISARYAFNCLKLKPRLPRSIPVMASMTAFAIVGTALLISRWGNNPDTSLMLRVEQQCQVVLCLVLWTVGFCIHWYAYPQRKRDIMAGFVALYSVGLITGSLRIYIPASREALWCADLLIQLGVVAWWIYANRKECAQ